MSKQHLMCSVQAATSLKPAGYFVPENDLLSIKGQNLTDYRQAVPFNC